MVDDLKTYAYQANFSSEALPAEHGRKIPSEIMKLTLFVTLALLFTLSGAFAEPTEKEFIALMNRVQSRIPGGDIKALDELTTMPGNYATPAFLTIFKQNCNVYQSTALNKAIGKRCAELATTTSGGEEYIVKLLKGKPANNGVFFQQESAIKCLVVVHNEMSVRILGGALDDVDTEEIAPKVTRALAELRPPGAPFSPKDRVSDSEALAKWKQWWASHKSDYPQK